MHLSGPCTETCLSASIAPAQARGVPPVQYEDQSAARRMSCSAQLILDCRQRLLCQAPDPASLRRYVDVLPCDAHRVKLQGKSSEAGGDYINASLVTSKSREQPAWQYLVTQVRFAPASADADLLEARQEDEEPPEQAAYWSQHQSTRSVLQRSCAGQGVAEGLAARADTRPCRGPWSAPAKTSG